MKGIRRIATLLVGFATLGANAFGQRDAGSNEKLSRTGFLSCFRKEPKQE